MLMITGSLVFAMALAASLWVFAFTLVPAIPRIAALLAGEADSASAERPALVLREVRIRSRARLAQPRPAQLPLRAAA